MTIETYDQPSDRVSGRSREAGIVQGLILSFVTFLPILATLSVAPAIPRLIEHFADIPNAPLLVTLLLAVPAIFIAITSPFVGLFTDRFGRKPVLVGGVALYGLFGMAPFFMEDLYAILATRAGVGVAEAMLVTVGKTLIGDYFTGERRQRWVGYQNAIDAALGTSMWFIGGYFASFGWRSPFLLYIVAVPLLIAVLLLIWEPESGRNKDKEARIVSTPFPWRPMLVVYSVTLFIGAMYFSYPTNIARALTELGVTTPTLIGILTAVASIGTPIGSLIYTRVTSLTSPTMIGVGLAFIGLGFVAIGLAGTYQVATGFAFLEQFGNGVIGAVMTAWCLSYLPFEHRGRGMGIWGTCWVAGIFSSPFLFRQIETVSGTTQSVFVILGIVCTVSALAVPLFIRATIGAVPAPGSVEK